MPVDVLRKRGKLDAGVVLALRSWLRRETPDVLHAFQLHPAAWSLLAVRTLPRAQRPVFVAGQRAQLRTGTFDRLLQTAVFEGSDAVAVNTSAVADRIRQEYGLGSERVRYLPNGIDLVDWDERSKRASPLTETGGTLRLAVVGSLRPVKNHQGVLEALSQVSASRRGSWRVYFVGAGTQGSPAALRLHGEIVSRGLENVVRLFPETSEMPALLRSMHGLVLPSLQEGFPNVVLEAMASRLPCIATAVGEVGSLIEEDSTGFLVPPGNAALLARALVRLWERSEPERRAMGERARRRVEERFSLERVAAAHRELYRSLLEGAGSRRREAVAP